MEDVLIIGGGFAGLAAGVALSKAGRRVRLLEQRRHLGGRAYSFRDVRTGSTVDNGQHIFMGCYHATQEFLKEIGTLDRIVFQPQLRLQFLDASGRLTALRCPNLPAPLHLLAGIFLSTGFNLRQKLEVARLGYALDSGRHGENGFERQTVEEWLRSLGQSEMLRRNFWDLLCIAALNEDPRIAAAVLFERVLRLALFTSPSDSCIGLARLGLSDCYTSAAAAYIAARSGGVETGRSVSEFLISGLGTCGEPRTRDPEPRPVPARLGQALKMGKPSWNGPYTVRGTLHGHTRFVCEGVRLADGEVIRARAVLSAVPSFQLSLLLPPDLLRSEPFFRTVTALRPAPIISINLWFDRPVTDVDFVGLRGTTVQWLFNKGKILGSEEGCVAVVLSGAHQHIHRSKDELLALALRELGELLPGVRQARLVHSIIIKERFATFSPGVDAEAIRPPSPTPVRGLYLAGDWTATGLPATIEGAVKSGYTAAEAILRAMD